MTDLFGRCKLRPARRYVLTIAVDCYAGSQGDETPRRFTRGDQLVEILAVVERWRTPDHRYFKVKTAARANQDEPSGCLPVILRSSKGRV